MSESNENTPLPAFTCSMCGSCCEGKGGIVVSAKDLERLCRHLRLSPEAFESAWGERRDGKLQVRAKEDGTCVFFEQGKGCGVHEAKPDICRAWPFFRGNLVDAESFSQAMESCPGIERAQEHEEFVRQGLEYLVREDLAGHSGPDEARALQVADLLQNLAQNHMKR